MIVRKAFKASKHGVCYLSEMHTKCHAEKIISILFSLEKKKKQITNANASQFAFIFFNKNFYQYFKARLSCYSNELFIQF